MEALILHKVIEKDGEISLHGLPFKKGQQVEMILLTKRESGIERPHITARQLQKSGLIGLWKNREDISDSSAYARKLRDQAQNRKD